LVRTTQRKNVDMQQRRPDNHIKGTSRAYQNG
jgi:hypothetical protein